MDIESIIGRIVQKVEAPEKFEEEFNSLRERLDGAVDRDTYEDMRRDNESLRAERDAAREAYKRRFGELIESDISMSPERIGEVTSREEPKVYPLEELSFDATTE